MTNEDRRILERFKIKHHEHFSKQGPGWLRPYYLGMSVIDQTTAAMMEKELEDRLPRKA